MNRRGKNFLTALKVLLFLLFSWLNIYLCRAQNSEQLLSFAKEQMESGNYKTAAKVLDRILFFDQEIAFPEALPLLAESYFKSGDYASARNCFDLAARRTDSDSLRTEYFFQKLLCDLPTENYKDAEFELLTMQDEMTLEQSKNFELIFAVVSFHLQNYGESRIHFINYNDSANIEAVNTFFESVDRTSRRYKPQVAKVLSIILPGTGQAYSGDYKNALNSILLTGGLALTGIYLSGYISFIDSAIIVLPWIQRYYMGGFQRASLITMAKQKEEKNKLLVSFLGQLN